MTAQSTTDRRVIRLASTDDAGLIARLNQDVHAPHVDARPDIFKPLAVNDELIDLIRERLANPGTATFIAEVDGEAIGYPEHFQNPGFFLGPPNEIIILAFRPLSMNERDDAAIPDSR